MSTVFGCAQHTGRFVEDPIFVFCKAKRPVIQGELHGFRIQLFFRISHRKLISLETPRLYYLFYLCSGSDAGRGQQFICPHQSHRCILHPGR